MHTATGILGHERNLVYLERVFAKDRQAHAYIFSGPEGIGKHAVAWVIAKALLCSGVKSGALASCGSCENCIRIVRGHHPDFIELSPEHLLLSARTQEMGIIQAHELARLLSLRSWSGGWKIAIVDQADRLSHDAQSAILKLFEEPHSKIIFFFITASVGLLLDTIRSRAIPLVFATLSDELLRSLLPRVSREKSERLITLARGRPGVLIRALADPDYQDTLIKEDELFQVWRRGDLLRKFEIAQTASGDIGVSATLLTSAIRSEWQNFFQCSAGEEGEGDRKSSQPSSIFASAVFLDELLKCFFLLETVPVNRRLLFDGLAVARSITEGNI